MEKKCHCATVEKRFIWKNISSEVDRNIIQNISCISQYSERLFHNIHYDILIELKTPEEILINKHESSIDKKF